jgi:hypothetical protein
MGVFSERAKSHDTGEWPYLRAQTSIRGPSV